jgi:hypothetical protein
MCIDPEHAAGAVHARHPNERPEPDGVIAAEDERQIPVPHRALDEARDLRPRLLDLREEPSTLVLDLGRLRHGRLDVAEVDRIVADFAQPRLQSRIADRGRAHVNTAPPRAEIERSADHGDFVNR